MAPIAQVFPLKDKNACNEKLKKDMEAKSLCEEVAPLSAHQERELKTYVANRTPKFLRRLDYHFWHGSHAISGSPNLASWTYAAPRQSGPGGVKWGVAYTDGEDSQDPTNRKWIAAFDTTAKKAYAEVGPIGPINWNIIEVKLALSTSNNVEFADNNVGGKTAASIESNGQNAHVHFY